MNDVVQMAVFDGTDDLLKEASSIVFWHFPDLK
jgi:hypothetical protein